MSVYKPKGSRFYQYDFQQDGVRFYGSTGKTSKRDAERAEAIEREKARSVAKKLAASRSGPMTVNVAFDRFWEEKGEHYRGNAKKTFLASLAWIAGKLGPETKLADVTARMVSDMVTERRAEGVKNGTVNRTVVEPLRRVMNRAQKAWDQELRIIPWGDLLLPEPKERVRELREHEETKLFDSLREDYAPLIEFALITGCRLEECVSLSWDAIDWGAGTISIRGKGDKVDRIPLTSAIRNVLMPLRDHHETQVFTYQAKRTDNRKGLKKDARYPVTYNGVKTVWRRMMGKSGIVDFRFHDNRHTAATRLLRGSGNLKLVQRLLRHEDIATTMKYAHASEEDLRDALEKAVPPKRPNLRRVK